MELTVKKDILDYLEANGLFRTREESEKFFQLFLDEIMEGVILNEKVKLCNFGYFYSNVASRHKIRQIPSASFLQKLGGVSIDTEETLAKIVDALCSFMKSKILEGNDLHLMSFASFRLLPCKSEAVQSSVTGQKVISPEHRKLSFRPAKAWAEKVQQKKITFQLDPVFQRNISLQRSHCILFFIQKKDFFFETLEYHFIKTGWRVNVACNIEDFEKFLESDAKTTHLIVVDKHHDSALQACEAAKCRRNSNLIPLVLLHPRGFDLKKCTSFCIHGDVNLIQPFELNEFLKVTEKEIQKSWEKDFAFEQEIVLEFPTGDANIDKANEICGRVFASSGFEEEHLIAFGAAFREALANASQHGNKHRRDKILQVNLLQDKEKIIVSVKDSGKGFDWKSYVQQGEENDAVDRARQSRKEGKLGGLGIMLMLRCADKVEYNAEGNVITLTRYLPIHP